MAQRYYPRRMRVAEKEEKQIITRLIITTIAIIGLGLAIVFGGVPALLSLTTALGRFSNNNTTQQTSQNQTPIIAPQLDAIPNATNSARITVTGTGEAGDSVQLFVNDQSGNQQQINSDGTFSFIGVQLREGTNTIYAKIQKNNQTSQPSDSQQIIYDNTPPKLDVSSPTDNQNINGNNVLKVTGKTDPNASVTVNQGIATVGADGSFTANVPLSPGSQQITIVATDEAGNQTTIQRNVIFNQ